MTPRQIFLAEIWKEETRAANIRLNELDAKREDCGLTLEEKVEYAAALKESGRLLEKMLDDLKDVKTA